MPAWSTLARTLSSSLAIIAKRQLLSMQQPCSMHCNVRGLPPLLPYRASSSHAFLAQPSQPRFGGPTEASVDRLHTNAHSSSHRTQARKAANITTSSSTAAAAVADEEGTAVLPVALPDYCSGCGVKLQMEDPDAPGFFMLPKKMLLPPRVLQEEDPEDSIPETAAEGDSQQLEGRSTEEQPLPSMGGRGGAAQPAVVNEGERLGEQLNEQPDDSYQAMVEHLNSIFDPDDWKDGGERQQRLHRVGAAEGGPDDGEPRVLCARCYSLQHYGRVKSQKAEAALPQFDLGRKVGRKIALQKYRRPVVLCVVDVADFDGSIPRLALLSLLPRSMYERPAVRGRRELEPEGRSWNVDRRGGGMDDCRLVVAANKADLLPPQATQQRLESWIRRRVRQAGLPRPDSVHLVSSTKQQGVSSLLAELQRTAGVSGDVWVVGAQNAGKSSLINSMRRAAGRKSTNKDVTTAALPGTTLGMLRIDGIMEGKARMFDTPGVPHDHQLSSRLSPDEVRLLLPRGRIKPRSFRVAAGQTVFVGGVARLDVVASTAATLYLTVWASNDIPCHFGKVEGAADRYAKMAGSALIPPLGEAARVAQLGPLLPADLQVEGTNWKASTADIAIAGLGWVGVGLHGTVHLRVWTHKGVAVTTHEALIPDLAPEMERPGLGNRTQEAPRVAKKKAK